MVPDIRELARHRWLGLGIATEVSWQSQRGSVILLNMNNFTEHQHQTSLLHDHDAPRQKQHSSLAMSKHRKNRNTVQATKMTKQPFPLTEWLLYQLQH